MTGFLKFVSILNAAVWCGSAIFLTVALPGLFTPEMKRVLTDAGVGYAAEAVVARFFILQYCCGAIALAHLVAEWLYYGRPLWRLNLALLAVVLSLGLIGGLWAQPKMRSLHVIKYFGSTREQQARAGKSFAAWHAASESVNLVVMAGLVWYLWRVSREKDSARFVSFSKFGG